MDSAQLEKASLSGLAELDSTIDICIMPSTNGILFSDTFPCLSVIRFVNHLSRTTCNPTAQHFRQHRLENGEWMKRASSFELEQGLGDRHWRIRKKSPGGTVESGIRRKGYLSGVMQHDAFLLHLPPDPHAPAALRGTPGSNLIIERAPCDNSTVRKFCTKDNAPILQRVLHPAILMACVVAPFGFLASAVVVQAPGGMKVVGKIRRVQWSPSPDTRCYQPLDASSPITHQTPPVQSPPPIDSGVDSAAFFVRHGAITPKLGVRRCRDDSTHDVHAGGLPTLKIGERPLFTDVRYLHHKAMSQRFPTACARDSSSLPVGKLQRKIARCHLVGKWAPRRARKLSEGAGCEPELAQPAGHAQTSLGMCCSSFRRRFGLQHIRKIIWSGFVLTNRKNTLVQTVLEMMLGSIDAAYHGNWPGTVDRRCHLLCYGDPQKCPRISYTYHYDRGSICTALGFVDQTEGRRRQDKK
ncbi:hypothetical protein FISHEDRAFT_55768 [Fistulina hepatica ATCC 64428]|uniref:Uncharacterized protein n=1 Tax=Fistulina hepatica ATCC 64428 TaxID=1128425 RepID=A0A0D7AML6_9AGAR|nr:hypothetical protein FISHEDRAFT_55768 [Fistulina hepatica ATCC 64428]